MNVFKKRYYILFVSRETDGTLNKVPVPLHYAYIFVGVAVIGLFTITGLAGSYSRMLIKMSRFNQVRQDRDLARANNAHLERALHEKDIQAASLGSLASEVSAIYGLTSSKLALTSGHVAGGRTKAASVATAPLSSGVADGTLSADSYYKSLDTFNSLRQSAISGITAKALAGPDFGHLSKLNDLTADGFAGNADVPTLWPVMGPITSSFGERQDPVLNNGEGEFHTGLDISAVDGTPIHATGDGTIKSAGLVNGYGRMVVIDHGHGILTCYGHMSGFAVVPGETVLRGQVIGYVGHSGRVTGSHLHYEVRIRNTPVNPHKYLRITMAQLGNATAAGE
ncbi:MAG TPA: M23 family metallopeptidase [Granulicella sp.]|nr:M23 family metallopeptidase [Granulicella sp.]